MIIKDINIISFGKLKNKQISFSGNFNVIYGKNESGKTTVSAFIEAMLYSFPPRSDRAKYLPWDNSTAAGEMTINADGRDVTFYREFAPQPKGDVLEPKGFSLKGLIPPDRDSYRKSIYSPEGSLGGFGTNDELDTVISNILATGDENIGAGSAVKNLEKLRRSLNSGGKLKEYDNKISLLENEYSASLAASRKSETAREEIEAKERLIKEYEKRAQQAENASDTAFSEALKKLDGLIASQEEYIKTFPESSITPPEKPRAVTKSLVFYILCTAVLFIAGFFTRWQISLLSLIPPTAFFTIYAHRSRSYTKLLKSFLASVQCADLSEYNTLLSDKSAAEEYYTALLKEKSDLVTKSSADNHRDDTLYRKILSLKYELDSLRKATETSFREPSVISGEIEYYKALRLELSQKLEAIRLAIDAIDYARDIIATDFTPKVTALAMSYLNRIAPKEGRSALLSRDMTITVSDPVHRSLQSQSFGFREEMYLCFRIAWSEFLFGKSFPLIIDDPFTGSDDERERALIDLLFSISAHRQVIIFTNRKNNYFNQLNCNWVDITP